MPTIVASKPCDLRTEGRGITKVKDQCGNYSYRMPQIHALSDGRLLMNATRFACNDMQLFDPEPKALQQPQMLLYFSEDLGRRWSKPQILPVELPQIVTRRRGRLCCFNQDMVAGCTHLKRGN